MQPLTLESKIERMRRVGSHFSRGNRKLPTSMLIFNLPSVATCPGRSPLCESNCYARKAEVMYPAVAPFRNRNLAFSRNPEFIPDTVNFLINKVRTARKTIKTVRIHESGDFYSQEYLLSWFEIARRVPNLQFYAYTKSFGLWGRDVWSQAPSNFRVINSWDDSMSPAQRTSAKTNFSAHMGNERPRGFFTCPGSCKTCDICFNPKSKRVRVHFAIH
jgi:hypothetical protein